MRMGALSLALTLLLAGAPCLAATTSETPAAKKPAHRVHANTTHRRHAPAKRTAKAAPPRPAPIKAALPVESGGPPPPPPPPPDPNAKIHTSDEVKRSSVGGAVTAPLRDLNVVRTKIPPVLLHAMTDPYARPPDGWTCAELVEVLWPLDEALGPDLDITPVTEQDFMDRTKSTALGAAADLASDAIPFRGWVRKLSGAERHDKLVQAVIIAGDVRRAYLKGLGEAKGCTPPATPSHERAGTVPAEDRGRFRPLYPTRKQPGEPQTTADTRPDALR